ncbi:hypothetical protein GCM10022198_18240 [Klugiella xanthotipulae]|uniref:Uncharacterized protein n=1 Tax=Klugiella xanthotipulae TaxID=244735 RepID=A0A543HRQ2_9MICO|nr:hypothetical protein [Klugiella xanthotipulae]TQM61027.1 hypothetical protein FB466_1954 [Klugiella xanthotipulae]
MELIFVVLLGILIGLVARYALPGRATYGVVVQLALGAAVSAAVWVGLTLLGLAWDGGWIWAITLTVTALVCVTFSLTLPRIRARKTELRLRELSRS